MAATAQSCQGHRHQSPRDAVCVALAAPSKSVSVAQGRRLAGEAGCAEDELSRMQPVNSSKHTWGSSTEDCLETSRERGHLPRAGPWTPDRPVTRALGSCPVGEAFGHHNTSGLEDASAMMVTVGPSR